ncbi:PEP-CTERM sorting domain-containing protein [Nostocaceae cyanobacterium CENA369]|uniref:PEP-CTERM sorting domain-containing protein n=1 Tax=Dendronalium phyllosphericum CENA369 TaxID=1725256 RepID=A0A8J7I2B1_9NOST|nr:PEP-CTERM sorting domain-containing protein [Dendronalium phyllosphericum]MBH8574396.1 PEP-CTERM sorting domain-containing protein [Dendronalium phyllosphericum CENA369]
MFRSHTGWVVPIAVISVGFGVNAESAIAKTNLPFSANYDTLNSLEFIPNTAGLLKANLSGTSTDALYGLTQVRGLTYGQFNSSTGVFNFSTDPTVFGLQGAPAGFVKLFGSGSDSLLGSDTLIGFTDFNNLTVKVTGTFMLTGGESRFQNASGTLGLSEFDELDPNFDLTKPVKGRVTVSGTFQTVPEPSTVTTLIGIGVIGIGTLLRRRNRSSTLIAN